MLISPAYQAVNRDEHERRDEWGRGAKNYVQFVRELVQATGSEDILDYGCGKGTLCEELGFPIHEYDPGIPAKSARPEPADIVVCASVLEHVEPDCVDDVLADLRRCTRKVGLFVIPHNAASDGDLHLSQHPKEWWDAKLSERFQIHSSQWVQSITSSTPGEIMLGSRTFYIVVPNA